MQAQCRPDDEIANAVVVALQGLFDDGGAAALWEAVEPRLDTITASVLVDLTGVDRVTSAGVGVLVRLLHRVQVLGGRLVVFGACARVREVIEVVRLAQAFNLEASIGEARERLRAGP